MLPSTDASQLESNDCRGLDHPEDEHPCNGCTSGEQSKDGGSCRGCEFYKILSRKPLPLGRG